VNNSLVGRKWLVALAFGLLATGCGQSAPGQQSAQAGSRVIANELRLSPTHPPTLLLTVRRMGRFRVKCPEGRAEVSFRHVGGASVDAVVDTTARSTRAEVIHPGGLMVVRSRRRASRQEWQLAVSTKARVEVADVSVAASPGDPVGVTGGCLVSAQAVVARRPHRNQAPSG
jgi:hypothetical protein